MTHVFMSHAERRRFERAQEMRNPKKKTTWTAERIREEFDGNWNLTLRQLSQMSGHTIDELKRILMEG